MSKGRIFIALKVLFIILGIVTIIRGVWTTGTLQDYKNSYIENVLVVIDYRHTSEGYQTYYKYKVGDTVYDYADVLEQEPKIASTERIWVDPTDPTVIILDSDLKDTGLSQFKLGIIFVLIGVFAHAPKIEGTIKDTHEYDIEDFLRDTAVEGKDE